MVEKPEAHGALYPAALLFDLARQALGLPHSEGFIAVKLARSKVSLAPQWLGHLVLNLQRSPPNPALSARRQ